MIPQCHPDRKHEARGLCKSCYNMGFDEESIRKRKVRNNRSQSKWGKTHKEEHSRRNNEWNRLNPDKRLAWEQRRRSRLTGYVSPDIIALLREQSCYYCGKFEPLRRNRTIDHRVPISKGGLHIQENLVPSCRSCNASKGNKIVA